MLSATGRWFGRHWQWLIGLAITAGAAFYAGYQQAIVAQRAPDLRASIYPLRTPVLDVTEAIKLVAQQGSNISAETQSQLTQALQTIVETQVLAPLLNTQWRLHMTIENVGKANASNVTVRAPALFARVALPGSGFDWRIVEREVIELGDLRHGDKVGVVVWIKPGRQLKRVCALGDTGCFTLRDVKVSAEHTAAKHERMPWRYPPEIP